MPVLVDHGHPWPGRPYRPGQGQHRARVQPSLAIPCESVGSWIL